MGEDLMNATGAQLILVTMPTLSGVNDRQSAEQLLAGWHLADASQGKRVLLLVAKEERTVRVFYGSALGALDQSHDTVYAENRIRSEFSMDKDDLSEQIRKSYGLLGVQICEAAHVTVPDSIDEGSSAPFYHYVGGFLIAIPILLLILWIVGPVFGLAVLSLSVLLNLLTSGKYSGGGGSGRGGGYGGYVPEVKF